MIGFTSVFSIMRVYATIEMIIIVTLMELL